MSKLAEFKDLSEKELLKKVDELKTEVFNLRFQKKTSGLEKPHQIKLAEKTVARCLTALNLKKKEAK